MDGVYPFGYHYARGPGPAIGSGSTGRASLASTLPVDVSMSTAKQLVQLGGRMLWRHYVLSFAPTFTEELKNTQPTSEHLFGAGFCDRVEKLATKLNNEEAVKDTVQSLLTTTATRGNKHKKSKKKSKIRKSSSPSAAPTVASGKASAAPTPSTSGSYPKGKR